jgi:hypothetical protein
MNNKKGISALIETVLLILVVIAAVGIVAGLLIPMIREAADRTATCQGLLEINSATLKGVTYTQDKGTAGQITAVSIIAYDAAGTATTVTGTAPTGVGNSQTAALTGTPIRVTVISTVNLTSGKLVACPAAESAIA